MKKMGGILVQILLMLWIVLILFFYFFNGIGGGITWRSSHQYYKDGLQSLFMGSSDSGLHPLFLILIVIGGGYLLFYVWKRWYRGEKKIDIHLSPFSLFLLFSLFFFVLAFSWFGFYHLNADTIVAPYAGIFMHYGFILSALGLILLVCAAVGKYVFHWLKRDAPYDLKTFLFSFGLGSMILTFILFLLGLGGWLQSIPVWGICIALLLITSKELWLWIKAFFKPQIHFQGSYLDVRILLLFLFFIVLGHNVLELIRPMPMGFDDLSVYMNVPNLLARGGTLLSGIDAYSWGIFMSLGYLLFHSTMITLFLSLLGGILVFFGFYVTVQSYGEQRNIPHTQVRTYALLSATLFFTLPTVVFQSAKDMKVDLAALFFVLLSFLAFLTWRKEKGEGESALFLWLSGLFMGFAFTMKYTVLFFMITMLLYALFELRRRGRKNVIMTLFLFILCVGIPFVPYAIKNVVETQQLSITSLRVGKSETPTIVLNPPLTDSRGAISPPLSTGVQEELGRYAGFDQGIEKYLMLPFTVTFNPVTSGMYVDIGYIFLAFIPLVLLSIRKPETENSVSLLYEILLAGGIYWILWGIFAEGVIWYGYGGFIFLLLLIVEVMYVLHQGLWKMMQYFVHAGIVLWLFCSLILRVANLPSYAIFIDPVGLSYARGVIDEQGYLKQKIPTYLTILNTINSDIDAHPHTPPKIYRIGTFIKYFIHQNNRLVLDDNQLDLFMYISQDHDDQKTIARLKNAGFKYMIIDTNTASIDKTPGKTLTAKYQDLIRFIQKNPQSLHVLVDEPQNGIMFVQIL
jgi:hypothetical protein